MVTAVKQPEEVAQDGAESDEEDVELSENKEAEDEEDDNNIRLEGLKFWSNGLCMVPARTKRMDDLQTGDVQPIPSVSYYENCVGFVLHWWGEIEIVGANL